MTKAVRRFWIIAPSLVVALLLVSILFMATQPRDSHRNLHYVAWKWGLASYDKEMVLDVMRFDGAFRAGLVGTSEQDFLKKFPNTFVRRQKKLLWASDEDVIYMDHPEDDEGWIALFRKGKLAEFFHWKGP